ncbi:MAG: hypothetical protein R3A52_19840 [Polyangiales bacterium]
MKRSARLRAPGGDEVPVRLRPALSVSSPRPRPPDLTALPARSPR